MGHAGQTRIGGASAGALLVACHHSGLSMELITEACLKLATDCRSNGTRGRLGVSSTTAGSPGEGASLHLAVHQPQICGRGNGGFQTPWPLATQMQASSFPACCPLCLHLCKYDPMDQHVLQAACVPLCAAHGDGQCSSRGAPQPCQLTGKPLVCRKC